MKQYIYLILLLLLLQSGVRAESGLREFISSDYYSYYENLVIMGVAERPTLIYHSFSNSLWKLPSDLSGNQWSERTVITPGPEKSGAPWLKTIDPDMFNSYNSSYPHGINDGALWQGKGYNSRLTSGAAYYGTNLSIILAPEILYMQNRHFSIMPSATDNKYGYISSGIDCPQRFGDRPIWLFSPGQSGIRYNYGVFTAGISTENVRLGPAKVNPLILSGNAPGFPHFDAGLTKIKFPYGEFEGRILWGYLKQSDYYSGNNSSLFNLITLAYAPSFIPGLIVGFNRAAVTRVNDYENSFLYYIYMPAMKKMYGHDRTNQLGSFTFEWLLPESHFTVYLEWGREDYSSNYRNIVRAPEHSEAYTIGFSKGITWTGNGFFMLSFELTSLMLSRDYEIDLGTGGGFYRHRFGIQGYTNEGQVLGAGIGTGANSQHLAFDYYFKSGRLGLFVFRDNRDNDYLYNLYNNNGSIKVYPDNPGIQRVNVEMNYGISGINFFFDYIDIYYMFTFCKNYNRNYIRNNDVINYYAVIGLRYRL
ncbi:MAG: capsule assembly Wzi family protein [Spirochaetes bacterium]|nr:capsule assembly Wzi family protein [Spirochaetota bacterium]